MNHGPTMTQFRLEFASNGIVHLVFDCPGRTMNVFSEAAIVELGAFAAWLPNADVRGVLIRSGKDNAFCAGADLTELGVAYNMIVAAPVRARFQLAYDHFFRLSTALRALETAGKPVAVAISGLALGGGCELSLAAHYRVLVDDARTAMGLPESLVGLLPGAGGTQRLPRLIGAAAALPILLEGSRLAGAAALAAGLVHALAEPGSEIAEAERWLLGEHDASQPWDRPEWEPASVAEVLRVVEPVRDEVLRATLGHYPAPLAILDCVAFGLPQAFDGAIRSEMSIFAHLIQREEPRNMIRTMFLGKTDHDRLARKKAIPDYVGDAVATARRAIALEDAGVLGTAGFGDAAAPVVRQRARPGYWLDESEQSSALASINRISQAVAPSGDDRSEEELRLIDYAIVVGAGYPAYLGGPIAFAQQRHPKADD